MDRAAIISRLQTEAAQIRGRGVESLYLFGSVARGADVPGSDVDLFIDYDPGRFGLLDLIQLQADLSALLRRTADLTTRDSLHPRLRGAIEAEAVPVF